MTLYDISDSGASQTDSSGLNAAPPQVRSYLASLADAFGLPREFVHAVAQTESGFDTGKLKQAPVAQPFRAEVFSSREFDPENKGYGVMQVSDAQIGRIVAAPDGSPFQIGDDVKSDWKANARAGVALLAQQHQLAEIEQPNASPGEHAQQAYSGYSAGASMRDRYSLTLPYSGLPAHPDDRAFLQNFRNALRAPQLPSFNGELPMRPTGNNDTSGRPTPAPYFPSTDSSAPETLPYIPGPIRLEPAIGRPRLGQIADLLTSQRAMPEQSPVPSNQQVQNQQFQAQRQPQGSSGQNNRGNVTITYAPGVPPMDRQTEIYIRDVLAVSGVDSARISATTNGRHVPNSWHYEGQAVDIDKINGQPVRNFHSDLRVAGAVESVQHAANNESIGRARENFGPAGLYREGSQLNGTVGPNVTLQTEHEDHVHLTVHDPVRRPNVP